MSYSKLIHDYLDVGLDEPTQEALFAEIARNPEVRAEFNSQLKINQIASQDLANIQPPGLVTKEVFSGLGFNAPSLTKPFLPNSVIMLLVGLLGAGIATIATLSFANDNNQNFAQNDNEFVNERNIPVSKSEEISSEIESFATNLADASINQIETKEKKSSDYHDDVNLAYNSNSLKKENIDFSSASRLNNKFDKTQKAESNSTLQDYLNKKTYGTGFISSANNDLNSEIITSSSNPNKIFEDENSLKTDQIIPNSPVSPDNNSTVLAQNLDIAGSKTNLFNLGADETKYQIGIKQLNYSNGSDIAGNSSINNLALSLVYKFNRGIRVVVEAGQENFYQNYNRIVSGTEVNTIQEPTLFWLGAGARYTQQGLFGQDIVSPFVQMLVAGTRQGPSLRPQLGLNIRFSQLISLTASYERPILFYNAFGQNYNNSKNAFSIGFNLNI